MKYLFTNVLGSFILDEHFKILDQILFTKVEDYLNKENFESKLKKKHPEAKYPLLELMPSILSSFKEKRYFSEFYLKNIFLTKQTIKNSVSEDALITQAIANIKELDKVSNVLVKRLREWYGLYFPELSEKISSPEKFTELVVRKKKEELLKEVKIEVEESMGAELGKVHVEEMRLLAERVLELQALRQQHEDYLSLVMGKYCPNLKELAGVTLGAKLLELGKSLKRLAMLPASTVQLLGAEKALFRHIKTGSRSPKYGIIINHPFVQKAPREDKGKAARLLADKLSLCVRLDYFKGEFKAKEYQKELEKKLKL